MAQFLKPSTEETAAFICEENKSHLHRQQFYQPSSFAKMGTVACGPMQVQKTIDDLTKVIARTQAELATKDQMLESSEARCTTLNASMHYEAYMADQCWSRAEALEKANIALKEEVEVLKREKNLLETEFKGMYERENSVRWRQLQDELKRKDELITYAVETRKAHKRSRVELMVKLASKEEQLKSTEARCAALEANLAEAQKTWCRNLEALEKDNVALKEEVHLLKSAQSQHELVITKTEKRQAQSKQSNQPETSEGSQELSQIEQECRLEKTAAVRWSPHRPQQSAEVRWSPHRPQQSAEVRWSPHRPKQSAAVRWSPFRPEKSAASRRRRVQLLRPPQAEQCYSCEVEVSQIEKERRPKQSAEVRPEKSAASRRRRVQLLRPPQAEQYYSCEVEVSQIEKQRRPKQSAEVRPEKSAASPPQA
ncbi:golgin subfamily A member 6-like protein 2 [Paralichthys olivaceus]|uniref:golgin subfamily A member 6-like protein 2 n=1 Tax=Paralichthys olivaceus TaxID=8255 RepID=UPI0037509EEC